MTGLRIFPRSRAVASWLGKALVGASLLGVTLPASVALAQSPDDGGWFDNPTTLASPDAYQESDAPTPSAPSPSAPAPAPEPSGDTDPSALTTFRPALDPYGAWVADPTYGTVWVPHREVVGEDFAPYVSRGHWALTADDDWIWVSDYPFGWAVFHYGRWVWISGRGWSWVPGRTYANAWVVWRVPSADYAYVGWAPMPPTWGWWNGYAVGLWWSPPLPYVFCPSAYVFDYRVHYHVVRDRYLVNDIARHTRVYPTPYHAPARPSIHGATPGVRTAAVSPSGVPRGPQISAARVPAQALPTSRAVPPAAAARLAAPQRVVRSTDFGARDRFVSPPSARAQTVSPRLPSSSPRVFGRTDSFSRPSSPVWSSPARSNAPSRIRVEPRSAPPAPRVHSAPSVSPRSFAPSSHSLSPMRGMGGGNFRRR